MKRILIALFAVPLMFLTACGVTTGPTETKVRVGAGALEDPVFKDCIPPSIKDNTPTNDDYFPYPTSERDLDATGQEGSDADAITVVSDDNAEMAIPVTLRFNMVTDCDTLKDFHKKYGSRYSAYLDKDGNGTSGWNLMLRKLMYDPVDTTLDEIAKNYTWRELYNDPAAQNELQNTLKDQIEDIVDTNARGHYFENYTVLVKKPYPTNSELADAIAREQAAVGRAQSAEAEAKAKKMQAEAEVAVAKAEAEKKQAEIRGYGGFENYNKAQAVENGLNPYQPTYKVGDTR